MGRVQRRFWVLWMWLVLLAVCGVVSYSVRGNAAARPTSDSRPLPEHILESIQTHRREAKKRALDKAGRQWLPDEHGAFQRSGTLVSDDNFRSNWEVLSEHKPRALFLEPFVSQREADELMRLAQGKLARSQVVDTKNGSGKVNSVRTSEGMFLSERDLRKNPLVVAVRQRVAAAAQLPVENVEATQILRYSPGQRYRMHPDFFVGPKKEQMGRGGQRVATVLTWLNDVASGGATKFNSNPPIVVPPRKLCAVLFYSVDSNGSEDSHSMHEGMPPDPGAEKWVAVHWVRRGRVK